MSGTFDRPVTVRFADSSPKAVTSVDEAERLLGSVDWPVRGPRHRDATETCAKVLGGARSAADARTAFVDAAIESGMIEEKRHG